MDIVSAEETFKAIGRAPSMTFGYVRSPLNSSLNPISTNRSRSPSFVTRAALLTKAVVAIERHQLTSLFKVTAYLTVLEYRLVTQRWDLEALSSNSFATPLFSCLKPLSNPISVMTEAAPDSRPPPQIIH